MKTKWYKGTQQDVQAYIDVLNSSDLLPVIDGQYRGDRWCTPAVLCDDGFYTCPQPPQFILDHFGIPQHIQDAIKAGYVTGKLTLVDEMPELSSEE